MAKTRIRYSQVRRLGTPGVDESDTAYAEGRYFEANCLVTDAINQFVSVTGVTLGVPNVTKVNPLVPSTMPAVGVIVEKPTTTTCLVQVSGQITSFSPVVAGSWYYIDTTAFPLAGPPAAPAINQVIGVGLDLARLLLRPGFGIEPPIVVDSEVPSGLVNGVNMVFTTALPFRLGTTRFYLNGVRQRPGALYDYVEGPGATTLTATNPPLSGDYLLVDYAV